MKKLALFLLLFPASVFVYAQNDTRNAVTLDSTKTYTIAQQMPKFNGDLEKYIQDNVKYPAIERSEGITGTVYVSFVVEKDGSISTVKILSGVKDGPGLDSEAVRVVKAMPAWIPGIQNDKPVRVSFCLPLHFDLTDNVSDTNAFSIVDLTKWPEFKDDAKPYLYKSFVSHLRTKDTSGVIYTGFIIEKDGTMTHINIISGTSPDINKKALQCLQQMGKWTPGEIKGTPVRTQYYLKINLNPATYTVAH